MTPPRWLLRKEDRTNVPKTCRQHQSPPTGVKGLSWPRLWQRGTFLVLGCANLNGIVPGKSGIQFQREDTLWVIWRKTGETSSSLLIQGALAKAAVRWELIIEPEQLQVTAPQLGCSKTSKMFLNPLQLDSKPLSEHIPKGQQWPRSQMQRSYAHNQQ